MTIGEDGKITFDYIADPHGWTAAASYAVTVSAYDEDKARTLAIELLSVYWVMKDKPGNMAVLLEIYGGPVDQHVAFAALSKIATAPMKAKVPDAPKPYEKPKRRARDGGPAS